MEQDSRKFIDPTQLSPIKMFNIVLVNSSRDFVSWGIKSDTNSNYNHAMTQRSPLLLDCQEMGSLFKTVPTKQYMVPANILKVWSIDNLTIEEWEMLYNAVSKDLNGPWWTKVYDYLGIVGQFLGLSWISMPGTYFCSKRVCKYLRLLPRFASLLPENVSPGFEDTFFNAHPELVSCVGYWWED